MSILLFYLVSLWVMVTSAYEPSGIVQSSHNLLHLNSKLEVVSNDFQAFDMYYWNNYVKSLLPVPIICGSLGLLAVFLLQLFLFLRMFYKQLRFLPEIKIVGRKSLTIIKFAIDPRYLTVFKVIITILIVLVDEIMIFGSEYLSQGVEEAKDAIDVINSNVTLLINEGNVLNTSGISLQQDLYKASLDCTAATSLALSMPNNYFPYVSEYLYYLLPIPGKCQESHNNLHKWGEEYKSSSIWVVYSVYLVLVLLFIIGMRYKNKDILRVSVAVSEITMIVLFILIGVVMVIVIGLADFCMNPTENVIGLIPQDIYNITAYYVTCTGMNPINPPLQTLSQFVTNYTIIIQQLLTTDCPNNIYLQNSLIELQSINQTIQLTHTLAECPPIQYQTNQVLQDGVCNDGYQGIYVIWIGQYLTTTVVLVVTIIIAYSYQYFGKELLLEAMNAEEEEDENGTEGDMEGTEGKDRDPAIEEERKKYYSTDHYYDEETGRSLFPVSSSSTHRKEWHENPNEIYAVTSTIHPQTTNPMVVASSSSTSLPRDSQKSESVVTSQKEIEMQSTQSSRETSRQESKESNLSVLSEMRNAVLSRNSSLKLNPWSESDTTKE